MLPSWYVISIIYKHFFQVNLVFSQRNRSHMQRILLLLPWLYHGLLFGKLTIITNCKINNVAAQLKKNHFCQRVTSAYKQRWENIKNTHLKFFLPFGFLCQKRSSFSERFLSSRFKSFVLCYPWFMLSW